MNSRVPETSSLAPADAPGFTSSTAVKVVKVAVNSLFVIMFVWLATSSYLHFVGSGTLKSFGVLAVNTVFVALYLAQRPAKSASTSLSAWLLAIGGSTVAMLMRPSDVPGFMGLANVVQIVGLTLLLTALLSLRRSFAVVASNRGIRQGGLYRIVRHPLYMAEIIVLLGVLLANPTLANLAVWLCECALQFSRACTEERFLAADPVSRAYLSKVRYRLVPGIL